MSLYGQDFPRSLNTIAIIGPGLIGGSLALALKRHENLEVRIWDRDSVSLQEAEAFLHPSRASLKLEEIIPGAQIIILCTPISVMEKLARQISPLLDENAVITDVGSVKKVVMRELIPIFNDRFVGGHPMAGSERNGVSAARRDLFENTMCILTPFFSSATAVQVVRDFWTLVGARTVEMTPEEHDMTVAHISHLPHAAAAALVKSLSTQNLALQKFAGRGYRDTTRIAEGDPDLWVDIFLENREPILGALMEYINQLQTLSQLLQNRDGSRLRSFLEEAQATRALLSTL